MSYKVYLDNILWKKICLQAMEATLYPISGAWNTISGAWNGKIGKISVKLIGFGDQGFWNLSYKVQKDVLYKMLWF